MTETTLVLNPHNMTPKQVGSAVMRYYQQEDTNGRRAHPTKRIARYLGLSSLGDQQKLIGVLRRMTNEGILRCIGTKKYYWTLSTCYDALPVSADAPFTHPTMEDEQVFATRRRRGEGRREQGGNNEGLQKQIDELKSALVAVSELALQGSLNNGSQGNNGEVVSLLNNTMAKIQGLDALTQTFDEKLRRLESQHGSTIKTIEIRDLQQQEIRKIEGRPHAMLEEALQIATARSPFTNERLNLLLVGPAGCGKSHLAKQLAHAMGLRFGFISCTAGMSEGQLLGRLLPMGENGQFAYSRSEFVDFYENGGLFLLDEVDAADPNTLLILNAALANGHMAVPNRPDRPIATRHPDFVCVAAANTYGTGADRQYVGRSQLDEAFLDRFRAGQLSMDYDTQLETMLCPDALLCDRLHAYRNNLYKSKVRRVISSRFVSNAYTLFANGVSDEKIDEKLFAGWGKDEVEKVKSGVRIVPRGKQEETITEDEQREALHQEETQQQHNQQYDRNAPRCAKCGSQMVEMQSRKGWRCGVHGNRFDKRTGWTICDYVTWNRKR